MGKREFFWKASLFREERREGGFFGWVKEEFKGFFFGKLEENGESFFERRRYFLGQPRIFFEWIFFLGQTNFFWGISELFFSSGRAPLGRRTLFGI